MELILKGGVFGSISNKCITITSPCTWKKTSKSITVQGKGQNTFIFNNGGRQIIQSCGNVYSDFGNICVSGSNVCVSGSNVSISGNNVGGSVYINGVKYQPAQEQSNKDSAANDEDNQSKIIEMGDDIIKSIKIEGSGELTINDTSCVSDSLSVSISGSGTVVMNELKFKFEHLGVNISGSGDVQGVNTNVKEIFGSIMGSGDITGFVAERGSLSIMGSGDISIYSTNTDNFHKSKMGSGSIKVKKIH